MGSPSNLIVAEADSGSDLVFEPAVMCLAVVLSTPSLVAAIESSELRVWEKAQGLHDTTDCVVMTVNREKPHCATIRLRIGFLAGLDVTSRLCAEIGAAD